MEQMLINALIAAVGGVFSFILQRLWAAINELQRRDQLIAEKIGQLEVLVAGSYLKREEFERTMHIVFQKLDKIDEKLDHKADR